MEHENIHGLCPGQEVYCFQVGLITLYSEIFTSKTQHLGFNIWL